jgi:hypothetical protein
MFLEHQHMQLISFPALDRIILSTCIDLAKHSRQVPVQGISLFQTAMLQAAADSFHSWDHIEQQMTG